MFFPHLPFERGFASIAVPAFTRKPFGVRRYRPEIAVSQVYLFSGTPPDDLTLTAQATFFDRAAILPWICESLGHWQFERLQAVFTFETAACQRTTAHALKTSGLIGEVQLRALLNSVAVPKIALKRAAA